MSTVTEERLGNKGSVAWVSPVPKGGEMLDFSRPSQYAMDHLLQCPEALRAKSLLYAL